MENPSATLSSPEGLTYEGAKNAVETAMLRRMPNVTRLRLSG